MRAQFTGVSFALAKEIAMKHLVTRISVAVIVGQIYSVSANAQTAPACPVVDGSVPAGVEYLYPESEPGHIDGEEPGSRVNVRVGPGLDYTASAYGLVGDYVDVIGQAFSTECETWLKVRFPISGQEGWIHGQFVSLAYARGLWD